MKENNSIWRLTFWEGCIMAKDIIKYIGSTPQHLTRATKDLQLRELAQKNKELLEILGFNSKEENNIQAKKV
jgi:hypothetical protein